MRQILSVSASQVSVCRCRIHLIHSRSPITPRRAEAIRGFTKDAAYAAFEENSRGTIEPGKLADLTIVEGDLYSMPQSELFKARVRYTVVGGEIMYRGAGATH